MNPHEVTPLHREAMQYLRDHPGMSYDRACEEVVPFLESRNRAARLAVAPPVKGTTRVPAYHEQAIAYMHDHPMTTYEAAIEAVQGDSAVTFHDAPAEHDNAMQYMRENPGMSYDAACDHVLANHLKRK